MEWREWEGRGGSGGEGSGGEAFGACVMAFFVLRVDTTFFCEL